MIVSRAPVRITLGGGGTDLESYYSRRGGGFVVSAAINRYVNISLNPRFDDEIWVTYSETECVKKIEDIKHTRVKEALKMLDVKHKLNIASLSEISGSSGMGSSSSFSVALLNGLHALQHDPVELGQLAEEACELEIELLKEPIGKQDQYIATYGGIQTIEIDPDGEVKVTPIDIPFSVFKELEMRILIFYTGLLRSASEILQNQKNKSEKDDGGMLGTLDKIKEIGYKVKDALEARDLIKLGCLMDEHWQVKKQLSGKISNPTIDRWYQLAMENGAIGGKIMGAGGGGFFMFFCPDGRDKLRKAMKEEGLLEIDWRFDRKGATILLDA